MKVLSIVLPIYNEEEILPVLRERLGETAARLRVESAISVEIIFVDDGSVDGSLKLLADWARSDPDVKVLSFSRNFGHQAALTAGLDAASGDAVVMMDADLQDPPELIPELVDRHAEGHDIVYARRTSREGEGPFKRGSAWLFYRIMKLLVHRDLPADTGDFRLLSRRALDALLCMRERHRFLRGMSTWLGFSQAAVDYERPGRSAGKTKFSTLKMLRFAWDAAVSFSTLPMTVVTIWGALVSLFGLGYLVYTVQRYFLFRDTVPGWATLVVLLCLIGGSILISLGIIGSYVGRIYDEAKERPLYIVGRAINLEPERALADTDRGEGVELPRRVGVEHEA